MKALKGFYQQVRELSKEIAAPLSPEDCVVQSMTDASPIRWHLAHTTWFFETFILKEFPDYKVFDANFEYLFNSYYNAVGEQYPRPKRGLLSRPRQEVILRFREAVDHAIVQRLDRGDLSEQQLSQIELGLHHEQQHQELMVTDLKHLLFCNALYPDYRPGRFDEVDTVLREWRGYEGGIYETGNAGDAFCFDNELPRHQFLSRDFEISTSLVTCGDYLKFIDDGGYQNPQHWLSLGWHAVSENQWQSPMYWKFEGDRWNVFTLGGWIPINENWPVCHVSFFEAEAFARWSGCRLPTESEWELGCESESEKTTEAIDPVTATEETACFLDSALSQEKYIQPTRSSRGMQGTVWEWTQSSYQPYPGFKPAPGAVGEYNGKFMCNQQVLRGGSIATPAQHIRPTYRNFFPPETRWQFSGIRLAK